MHRAGYSERLRKKDSDFVKNMKAVFRRYEARRGENREGILRLANGSLLNVGTTNREHQHLPSSEVPSAALTKADAEIPKLLQREADHTNEFCAKNIQPMKAKTYEWPNAVNTAQATSEPGKEPRMGENEDNVDCAAKEAETAPPKIENKSAPMDTTNPVIQSGLFMKLIPIFESTRTDGMENYSKASMTSFQLSQCTETCETAENFQDNFVNSSLPQVTEPNDLHTDEREFEQKMPKSETLRPMYLESKDDKNEHAAESTQKPRSEHFIFSNADPPGTTEANNYLADYELKERHDEFIRRLMQENRSLFNCEYEEADLDDKFATPLPANRLDGEMETPPCTAPITVSSVCFVIRENSESENDKGKYGDAVHKISTVASADEQSRELPEVAVGHDNELESSSPMFHEKETNRGFPPTLPSENEPVADEPSTAANNIYTSSIVTPGLTIIMENNTENQAYLVCTYVGMRVNSDLEENVQQKVEHGSMSTATLPHKIESECSFPNLEANIYQQVAELNLESEQQLKAPSYASYSELNNRDKVGEQIEDSDSNAGSSLRMEAGPSAGPMSVGWSKIAGDVSRTGQSCTLLYTIESVSDIKTTVTVSYSSSEYDLDEQLQSLRSARKFINNRDSYDESEFFLRFKNDAKNYYGMQTAELFQSTASEVSQDSTFCENV